MTHLYPSMPSISLYMKAKAKVRSPSQGVQCIVSPEPVEPAQDILSQCHYLGSWLSIEPSEFVVRPINTSRQKGWVSNTDIRRHEGRRVKF